MLSDFIHANRAELIERCRAKAARRNRSSPAYNADGIPTFITQLVGAFHAAEARHASPESGEAARPSLDQVPTDIQDSAERHGKALYHQGLRLDQVVHDYGDLCQALTELAMERDAPISVDEFHTFNRCLDEAIAAAVTAFARRRGHPPTHWNAMEEKPQSMEQQARDLLKGAILSFSAIRSGQVGLKGTTSSLHERSLVELQGLLDVVLGDSGEAGAGKTPP